MWFLIVLLALIVASFAFPLVAETVWVSARTVVCVTMAMRSAADNTAGFFAAIWIVMNGRWG